MKSIQYYAVGADPIPLTTVTTPHHRVDPRERPGRPTVFYWVTDHAGNVDGPYSVWYRPIPVVTPSSLDLVAPPGVTSPPQTVVLTNQGTTSLSIKGVATTDAAFTVATSPVTPCGATLLPQASCNIDVVFRPSTLASYQGTLEILTDTPTPIVSVPLGAVGEHAAIELDPAR